MDTGVFYERSNDGFGGIYVMYNVGGRFEKKGFRGISHLAEHLKCKAEKQFQREINTLNLDTNAFTDDTVTMFYCKGGCDELAKFAQKYLSCLDFTPPEDVFEAEKKIVLQEYRSHMNDYVLANAYTRSLLGYGGAIGFEYDISNISYKKFMSFYRKNFSLPVCVVFVGNSKMEKIYLKIRDEIKTQESLTKPINYRMLGKPDLSEVKAWAKKSTRTSGLFLDMRKAGFSTLSLKFFARLLSDGFYSPMWQNIREKKSLLYSLSFILGNYGKAKMFEFIAESDQWEEVKAEFFNIFEHFDEYVSRQHYDDYIKKVGIYVKQCHMKPNSEFSVLAGYGVSDYSFIADYDASKPDVSYETVLAIKDWLKSHTWTSMEHYQSKIEFSDVVPEDYLPNPHKEK